MKTPVLIECPRDAMQGMKKWIPTQKKIGYIQSLLEVGFDVLDVGSFVSPKGYSSNERYIRGAPKH